MYLGLWACWQFVLFWSVALIEVGFRDGMKYPRRYLPAGQGKTPHEYKSVSRNGIYKIYDHMHVAFPRIIPRIMPSNHALESYPRIIPRIIPMILKPCFETSVWIRKSWWSSPVAVKSCVQFLCQTMSPEWLSTQDVHFLKVFDTALFFHFSRNSCTPESYLRNIPRIIPPDATRFADTGIFGKNKSTCYCRSRIFDRITI